jgi:hypothetical protein
VSWSRLAFWRLLWVRSFPGVVGDHRLWRGGPTRELTKRGDLVVRVQDGLIFIESRFAADPRCSADVLVKATW